MSGERGQIAVAAAVLIMVLMLVAGTLVDALHWMSVRRQAYHVASDAALQAARVGAEYPVFIISGNITINEGVARQKALDVVAEEAPWANYHVEVAVITGPGGGVVPSFPPVARSAIGGQTDWVADSPAVGVYISVPVDFFFLGFLGIAEVHAFAAAELETQTAP